MPRPRAGYGKTKDGRKFVGVTTVLSYFGNKGGMIHAAWQLGMDQKNYRDIWYGAADAGSLAHLFIDHHLMGKPEPDTSEYPKEVIEKAETAFLGFLKWSDLVNFTTISNEESLFDETLGLAGTPDLAAIQGKRCIIDWKTSKEIYPENFSQISAYKYLWEVNHPDQPIEDCYILQLNKETGGFGYFHEPNLTKHWEFFKHVLGAYRLYKEIGGK